MKARTTQKIVPVILRCERQREQVDRMVEYCEKLDGTHLHIVDAEDRRVITPHSALADEVALAGFHQVAAEFAGRPFCWLETDSIPTQPGWLAAFTKEYHKSKKHFMLSSDCAAPAKLVSGIGIHGPETSWLVPKSFPPHEMWDSWIVNNLAHATHFTPIIQHRYCAKHEMTGHFDTLEENSFPRDSRILRSNSMIFHSDKQQSLMLPENRIISDDAIMRHSGDLGDIIAALPLLRERGGGRIILFDDRAQPEGRGSREALKGARFEAIKPLLEAQPYVTEVEWGEGDDTNTFRAIARPRRESLTERQARHLGLWPLNLSPWLTVPVERHQRILIARSARYHNQTAKFPWHEIVRSYGDRPLFIGLKSEHEAFEKFVGHKIEHAETKNLLDVARLIAGSLLFYANQSCPLWIALGLGTRVVVEVWPYSPNSEIHTNPKSFWAETPEQMEILRSSLARVRSGAGLPKRT